MVDAEKKARKNTQIKNTKQNDSEELKVKEIIPYKAINAILPISNLIVSMFYFIFPVNLYKLPDAIFLFDLL